MYRSGSSSAGLDKNRYGIWHTFAIKKRATKNTFVILESSRSIANKVRFAVKRGLAGVAAVHMQFDDYLGVCAKNDDTFVDFQPAESAILNIPQRNDSTFPLLCTINEAIDLTLDEINLSVNDQKEVKETENETETKADKDSEIETGTGPDTENETEAETKIEKGTETNESPTKTSDEEETILEITSSEDNSKTNSAEEAIDKLVGPVVLPSLVKITTLPPQPIATNNVIPTTSDQKQKDSSESEEEIPSITTDANKQGINAVAPVIVPSEIKFTTPKPQNEKQPSSSGTPIEASGTTEHKPSIEESSQEEATGAAHSNKNNLYYMIFMPFVTLISFLAISQTISAN